MGFHYPHHLYFLLGTILLGLLYIWSRWKRRRELRQLGEWRLIRSLVPHDALIRRQKKDLLALVAFIFLAFAVAGPMFGSKLKEIKRRGVDVFIAMDTSRSMLAEDIKPSRLQRAKRTLSLLVQKLEGNRVGIIAFAKYAVIQCPLTVDSDAARMFLDLLDTNTVPEQGTAIGDAIRTALKAFPENGPSGRALVLLTDGEDHMSDPLGAAREAKEKGVTIFTIGIGTSQGEVIKERNDQGKVVEFHKYKGEMVLSRLDDALLTKIAKITGGHYYRASSTDQEIDEIAEILNGYDKSEFSSKIYQRLEERYQFFAFIALILLLLELFISERRGQWGRIKNSLRAVSKKIEKMKVKKAALFLFVLLIPILAHADMKDHVQKAQKLLKKGDAAAARAELEMAQIDAPEAPILPYNIGLTYYMEGNTKEAERQFNQARTMSDNPAFNSLVEYNLGHLKFHAGERDEAINHFKNALRLNPNDEDAKYNIEYILSGKNPPQPPQSKPSPTPGDNNQDDKKDKDESSKGDNSDDSDKKEKDQGSGENEDEKNAKENAERILEMIQDQESDNLKNAKPFRLGTGEKEKSRGAEDW